jgi:cysteine desulfurase
MSKLSLVLPEATTYMENLRNGMEEKLRKVFPGLAINGEGPRIANTSNLSFPRLDGETLLLKLDMAGIAVSHGSACSSGALEPSRVLLNMGYPKERARSSIRISLSRMTTAEELDQLINVLTRLT